MKLTLRTRKPINTLESKDMVAFPVWEFASDEEGVEGQDETWVRPVKTKVIPADSYSLSVAAHFITASGKELPGLVGVTTAGAIKLGPAVLLPVGKYIVFPFPGDRNAEAEFRAAAALLGMSEAEVFPLRYQLKVLVEDESIYRSGEIGP